MWTYPLFSIKQKASINNTLKKLHINAGKSVEFSKLPYFFRKD